MGVDDTSSPAGIPQPADHLCVLVHGLWGSPSHLDFIASSLRERHKDRLHVLAAQQNTGHFTYDGIELGGERLAHEIEQELDELAEQGHRITKLSIVGYSLGGLVARYALGLLYARGWFDKVQPVNFTTFVSPHVGARVPLKGVWSFLFNFLGPRTISASGEQLFLVDDFRDSGRPLLSILADPDSIFMHALTRFKNRCVYANIVNDRSTVFYTTAMSSTDPFEDLEQANINYVKGYESVVIDPDQYLLPSDHQEDKMPQSYAAQVQKHITGFFKQLPLWLLILILIPIGLTVFLFNSVIQTFRSQQRIRLHEEGKTDILYHPYRVPIISQKVQHALEEALEDAGSRQDFHHLSATSSDNDFSEQQPLRRQFSKKNSKQAATVDDDLDAKSAIVSGSTNEGDRKHPTLALTPVQLSIIASLNSIGFRKYPVHIHNHRHSHAAIIVRVPKKGFDEGRLVVKHWLDVEFEV